MKKILVTGANGMQGTQVVTELQKKEYVVEILTTDKQKVSTKNVKIHEGNFSDYNSLKRAMSNVDGVYFVLPLNFDNELIKSYTSNFIKAAQESSIQLVVFNSSIFVPNKLTGIAAFDIKLMVEQMLEASELPTIYLRPRVYIDNIAAPWSIPAIVNNAILPYPIDNNNSISWVSHQDMARYVVASFESPNLIGKKLEIGNTPINGSELSSILSKKLDSKVNYLPVSPDDFQTQLQPLFGEIGAKSVADIYRYLNTNIGDFQVTNDSQKALKITPTNHEEWIENIPWLEMA